MIYEVQVLRGRYEYVIEADSVRCGEQADVLFFDEAGELAAYLYNVTSIFAIDEEGNRLAVRSEKSRAAKVARKKTPRVATRVPTHIKKRMKKTRSTKKGE